MLNRRTFMAISAAMVASPAFALTESQARRLVDATVADINKIIASGRSVSSMISDFEKVFTRYADVPTIARSALGPAARGASSSELSSYTSAFRGYIARKYGKRFNEFKGGKITVRSVTNRGKFFEVNCQADLPGSSPFAITFRVSDRSGKDLFFDLIVEGISLLSTERAEIGAMLDRRGGSIAAVTRDLASAG